jgi:hypothetical protein
MSEQRAHPRYAIELDAQLLPVDGTPHIDGRTHDISRGGFCMLAQSVTTPPVVGSVCEVRLSLVFSETEFSEPLALPGTIMWCTRLKQGLQVGVKFEGLDQKVQGYLDLFIRFLEGDEDLGV